MRKMQEYIEKGNRIFVGLEDSKKTWKVCVRCDRMIVHETSMPAEYEILQAYLMNRYPECMITVMYEAGFHGFWLHDLLEEDGIDCKERYKVGVRMKKSCPGIGWLTAIRLTLEWGEMRRFPTGKQIASFAGLTSREYSSGDTVHRGCITGQSSEYVRSWLIECAWRAIRKDPVLLAKFNAVWRNSGSRKKAIVAAARKLSVRLWALETTGKPYCIGVVE